MSVVNDIQISADPARLRADRFPAAKFAEAGAYLDAYAAAIAQAAHSIKSAPVEQAAAILIEAYTRGACVYSCGNGGSASVANHLQCDHIKGVGNGTDLSPRVVSLCANVEILTAIANDVAYEEVFSYQLQSQSRPGDVLMVISSSGKSANIVRALTWAREHGLRTIALTGFDGGDARAIAEVAIHVDCNNYGVVEDTHQMIMHALAQYIRQSRMTPAAVAASVF
jgi:D-sedoheptulose 7-phosphate isomerase/D-glycero-D-manno-heptose 1,7-bisphosphate phosphatase